MPKILVIDDDLTVHRIIQRALQPLGYEVVVAADGQEGLELALKTHPALIICDWMMPYLDGLEVCRRIKADPSLSTTFFILLTSRVGLDDRIEGLNTGADDFFSETDRNQRITGQSASWSAAASNQPGSANSEGIIRGRTC